jgi:hypothetical protein
MSKTKLTPEQALELVNFLDIDAPDLETAKTNFGATYFTKDSFLSTEAGKAFIGQWEGTRATKFARIFKKFGVDIPNELTKGKNPEEIAEKGLELFNDVHEAAKGDLEKKYAGTGDEKYKTLEEKFKALESKIPQYENQVTEYKTKLENTLAEGQGKIKEFKLKTESDNIWKNFKFKPVTEYKSPKEAELIQSGFKSTIQSKYKLEFDENEKLVIKTSDGNLIPNPGKAAAFLTPDEVLQKEGIDAGVISINPRANERVNTGGSKWRSAEKKQEPNPDTVEVFIHPSARANERV